MDQNEGLFRLCIARLASIGRRRQQLEELFDMNVDFDKFRPEILKMCIARIMRQSHTEGFLKSGGIKYISQIKYHRVGRLYK